MCAVLWVEYTALVSASQPYSPCKDKKILRGLARSLVARLRFAILFRCIGADSSIPGQEPTKFGLCFAPDNNTREEKVIIALGGRKGAGLIHIDYNISQPTSDNKIDLDKKELFAY